MERKLGQESEKSAYIFNLALSLMNSVKKDTKFNLSALWFLVDKIHDLHKYYLTLQFSDVP